MPYHKMGKQKLTRVREWNLRKPPRMCFHCMATERFDILNQDSLRHCGVPESVGLSLKHNPPASSQAPWVNFLTSLSLSFLICRM